MSVESAKRFLDEAELDGALRKRLAELKGRTAIDDLVVLAAERGYDFSVSDYREAIVQAAAGELSEESLRAVRREMGLE